MMVIYGLSINQNTRLLGQLTLSSTDTIMGLKSGISCEAQALGYTCHKAEIEQNKILMYLFILQPTLVRSMAQWLKDIGPYMYFWNETQ